MATITEYVEFNGVKTSDFNFIASGENAFNAPARVYEMIDIPGRDGQFAMDMGRYENIDVAYHCANHEPDDMATFRANLDGLRNAFLSARGYQRLEDTFHPDEYRMAVYKSGLEAKMIGQAYASEFDLVFNCKPQRFLKSGETAVSVASGSTIVNPTAFESKPLIEAKGTGNIKVGDYSFSIVDQVIGSVILANPVTMQTNMFSALSDFQSDLVANGNTIRVDGSKYTFLLDCSEDVDTVSVSTSGAVTSASATIQGERSILVEIEYGTKTFSANKSASSFTYQGSATVTATSANNSGTAVFSQCNLTYENNYIPGAVAKDKVELTCSPSVTGFINSPTPQNAQASIGSISARSTASASTLTMYFDSELGDAYSILNGQVINRNSSVLGLTQLPLLVSGSNAVTYDNTITNFKITPRWWQI